VRLGILLVLAALAPVRAVADPVTVNGSGRVDFYYLRDPSPGLGVEDGATNLEGWFDLRAFSRSWDASARLRVHQSQGVTDDPSSADVDRRHLAFRAPRFEVLGGDYYLTLGNGLLLRAIEQRFVTLDRVDRAFNLDRRLDGVRITADAGPVRGVLLSGNPTRTGFAGSPVGGAEEKETDDLLQGGEVTVYPRPFLGLGFDYLSAEITSPDENWVGRAHQDLASYRVEATSAQLSGRFEYAEIRPGAEIADAFVFDLGVGRYARVEAAAGNAGVSLEWKSYRRFQNFRYHQPPTLVRTQESVLLNRATHLVNLEDERGIQVEATWSPGEYTEVIGNVATADDSEDSPVNRFREVFGEIRSEIEGLGAGRLDLDWARDGREGVANRWTAALELERFVTETWSVILDAEGQRVDADFGDHHNLLGQVGVSRAGRWTATVSIEHTTDPIALKENFAFASLDLRLNPDFDLTLGYGSRPAGTVCSGGFCFYSPEFEGAEFRLLTWF